MGAQLPMYPVSDYQCLEASYRLDEIHDEIDLINAVFDQAKKDHKDGLAAKALEVAEVRGIIQRHKQESREGVIQAQLDAVFNQEEERRS